MQIVEQQVERTDKPDRPEPLLQVPAPGLQQLVLATTRGVSNDTGQQISELHARELPDITTVTLVRIEHVCNIGIVEQVVVEDFRETGSTGNHVLAVLLQQCKVIGRQAQYVVVFTQLESRLVGRTFAPPCIHAYIPHGKLNSVILLLLVFSVPACNRPDLYTANSFI